MNSRSRHLLKQVAQAPSKSIFSWKYMFMETVTSPHQHFVVRQDEIEKTGSEGIYRVTSRRRSLAYLVFSSDDRTSLVKQGREFLLFQSLQRSNSHSVGCQSTPCPKENVSVQTEPEVNERISSPLPKSDELVSAKPEIIDDRSVFPEPDSVESGLFNKVYNDILEVISEDEVASMGFLELSSKDLSQEGNSNITVCHDPHSKQSDDLLVGCSTPSLDVEPAAGEEFDDNNEALEQAILGAQTLEKPKKITISAETAERPAGEEFDDNNEALEQAILGAQTLEKPKKITISAETAERPAGEEFDDNNEALEQAILGAQTLEKPKKITISAETAERPAGEEFDDNNEALEQAILGAQTLEKPKKITISAETAERPAAVEESDNNEEEAILEGHSLGKPKHSCLFCQKVVTHFSRHLRQIHPTEKRVMLYISSTDNKEKSRLMKKLIEEGDAAHNRRNPQSPIPVKRAKNAKERIACPHCQLHLSVKHISAHIRQRHPGQQATKTGLVKAALTPPIPHLSNAVMVPSVQAFLRAMRIDERRILLASDKYLILHANSVFQNALNEKKLIAARSTITIVLRLITEMKKMDETLKTSVDCVTHRSFPCFIKTIEKVCGREDQNFKQSSVVNMYGQAFKKFAKAMESFLICDNEIEQSSHVSRFLQLFNNRFTVEVGSCAKQLYEVDSYARKQEVPLMEDVVKLNDYVMSLMNNSKNVLLNKFSNAAYIQLVHSLFIRWWVFNRRRVAEIEYLTIDDWNSAVELHPNSEGYKLLTKSEQLMSASFRRLSICGKNGRVVSLLVHKKDIEAVDVMLAHRLNADIQPSNRYLFTTGVGRVNGSSIMRAFSEKCGAETPRLLRGTHLRRHAAVCAQYLSLETEDLRQLSQALGHTTRTHMDHYRKPEAAIHLGRVSILMCALNKGNISKYKNKNLEDIDLGEFNDDDDEIDEESEQPQHHTSISTHDLPLPSTSSFPVESSYFPVESDEEYVPLCTPEKTQKRKGGRKIRWETPERKAVKGHFGLGVFSPNTKMPTLPQCSDAINNYACLKRRTPSQVHAFISNTRKKNKVK